VVAGLIDAGFVTPTRGRRNEWRFTFQDLMLLRTAHALHAQHIPPRRILRSLGRLKAALPSELPLTGLRITAVGADVAVRDRSGVLEADSGQLLIDFDVAPVAGQPVVMPDLVRHPVSLAAGERHWIAGQARNDSEGAQAIFQRALAIERSDPVEAEAAYLQALALDPTLEDAYLNLGAMWAAAGRYSEVVRLSDAALQHCGDCALVHFNRGVALDHLELLEEAAASYERSLTLDPTLADAHFNLAQLHQEAGDERGALRHYSAYRRLQR
jgi:tetratricopeptide (TPR) repeat protein